MTERSDLAIIREDTHYARDSLDSLLNSAIEIVCSNRLLEAMNRIQIKCRELNTLLPVISTVLVLPLLETSLAEWSLNGVPQRRISMNYYEAGILLYKYKTATRLAECLSC